ncbi:MAG: hypothetical protein K2H34_11590, partial [Lachnospiraceae bacterium]|nr:hypothetical protein [Lachnospiraceae bacterium]
MGLLNVDVIEDLVHSSSISKGIERTMEHIINELEIDSMYIIHCEEEIMEPEITYEWESQGKKRDISLGDYIKFVEEYYHFDEEDLFVARATTVLPSEEKQIYQKIGYEAVVEYRMTNHGNVVGYIVSGWENIKQLSDEDINSLHVLMKLMNEMLLKQFFKDIVGESDWKLFKMEGLMTKTIMCMMDEEYRILYLNQYAKERYPNIQMGDYCYQVIQGCDSVCAECPLRKLKLHEMTERHMYIPYLEDSFYFSGTKVKTEENKDAYVITLQMDTPDYKLKKRRFIDRKSIFAMKSLFKDMIAVELRRDTFYDLFKEDMDNKRSYSMDFVLKWLSKIHLDDKQKFLECFDINFLQNAYMNGEQKKEIDFRYRTHEGTYHCMNGNILFEQNINKEVMAYILFQDVEQVRSNQIEEYRQMRESLMAAKSSAELKGQILANISHEIRTPMSGIISMSSVARQTYNDESRHLERLSEIDDY